MAVNLQLEIVIKNLWLNSYRVSSTVKAAAQFGNQMGFRPPMANTPRQVQTPQVPAPHQMQPPQPTPTPHHNTIRPDQMRLPGQQFAPPSGEVLLIDCLTNPQEAVG